MSNKPAGPQLEWVTIPARRIYAAVGLLAALAVLGIGAYLWFYGGHRAPARSDTRAAEAALLGTFEGTVRVVRADTREISFADANTRLHPGDTLQTEATGRATLMLADGSTLTVRPNSVVTISENASAGGGSAARVRVAVEGGQVRVSTERQTPETSNVVETPLAGNKLTAQTAASFDVHADKSEEVRISTGVVERSGGGKQTALRAGEYVAFSRSGEIKQREQLLDPPVPYAPPDRASLPAQASGATVTLQWTRPQATTPATYRVEIASSPFFVRPGIVFERDRLSVPKLIVTELRPGNYFWRVRAEAAAGQASEWYEPQKFTVTPNEKPADTGAAKSRR